MSAFTPSASTSSNNPNAPTPHSHSQSHDDLSPTEEALLSEYALLSSNLALLSDKLSKLADTPTSEILDELRALERKTSTVFTLLKASVYSIVLEGEVGGSAAAGGGGVGDDGADAGEGR